MQSGAERDHGMGSFAGVKRTIEEEGYPSLRRHRRGEPAGPAPYLPAPSAGEPVPIWLAALLATSCEAQSLTRNHAVRWDHISGRAIYTNAGNEDEHIEPFGVRLPGGQTLAVSWMPGATAYTIEVFSRQ